MQPQWSRVENYFQRTAVDFDSLYERKGALQHWFNRTFRKAIFERVRLTVEAFASAENFSVLDVGSGSGRNSVAFAQAGARRVLGIDFAQTMVELARQYAAASEAGRRCEFLHGDFFQAQFSERFDFVVALGVFDYVTDAPGLLRRMADLAGCKVMASFPAPALLRASLRKARYAMKNCPVYFYTRERVEEVCRRAGLADYAILPCTSAGHMLIVNTRKQGQ